MEWVGLKSRISITFNVHFNKHPKVLLLKKPNCVACSRSGISKLFYEPLVPPYPLPPKKKKKKEEEAMFRTS